MAAAQTLAKSCPLCNGKLPRLRPKTCPSCDAILSLGPSWLTDDSIPKMNQIVRDSRFPPEAWDFVYRAVKTGAKRVGLGKVYTYLPGTPQSICHAFREAAFRTFGSAVETQLQSWAIMSSKDLFELLLGFCEMGLFRMDQNDSREAYDNLFVVGDAFWNAPDSTRGLCLTCNYDLRATPTLLCPECGKQN